jgi:hypothetical protein
MSATFDGRNTADMDTRPEAMVFNSSVSLKDSWTKIEGRDGGGAVACPSAARLASTSVYAASQRILVKNAG